LLQANPYPVARQRILVGIAAAHPFDQYISCIKNWAYRFGGTPVLFSVID